MPQNPSRKSRLKERVSDVAKAIPLGRGLPWMSLPKHGQCLWVIYLHALACWIHLQAKTYTGRPARFASLIDDFTSFLSTTSLVLQHFQALYIHHTHSASASGCESRQRCILPLTMLTTRHSCVRMAALTSAERPGNAMSPRSRCRLLPRTLGYASSVSIRTSIMPPPRQF